MKRLVLALTLAVVAVAGCKATEKPSRFPPAATRQAPPPNIADTALAVGQSAPALDLPSHEGERYVLANKLQNGPAVLVFYRGDW